MARAPRKEPQLAPAPDDLISVRFLSARTVTDHNGEVEQSFEAGKVYALNKASADRWIVRGAAEIAIDEAPASPAPPPASAPAEKEGKPADAGTDKDSKSRAAGERA